MAANQVQGSSSTAVLEWTIREQLVLASAVQRSGDQNWVSVSRAIKPLVEDVRPTDYFSQKNCVQQYATMLDKVTTPNKRKKRVSEEGAETVEQQIVRELSEKRIRELNLSLGEIRKEYFALSKEVELLEKGELDDKVPELWERLKQEQSAGTKQAAESGSLHKPKHPSPPGSAKEAHAPTSKKNAPSIKPANEGADHALPTVVKAEPNTPPTTPRPSQKDKSVTIKKEPFSGAPTSFEGGNSLTRLSALGEDRPMQTPQPVGQPLSANLHIIVQQRNEAMDTFLTKSTESSPGLPAAVGTVVASSVPQQHPLVSVPPAPLVSHVTAMVSTTSRPVSVPPAPLKAQPQQMSVPPKPLPQAVGVPKTQTQSSVSMTFLPATKAPSPSQPSTSQPSIKGSPTSQPAVKAPPPSQPSARAPPPSQPSTKAPPSSPLATKVPSPSQLVSKAPPNQPSTKAPPPSQPGLNPHLPKSVPVVAAYLPKSQNVLSQSPRGSVLQSLVSTSISSLLPSSHPAGDNRPTVSVSPLAPPPSVSLPVGITTTQTPPPSMARAAPPLSTVAPPPSVTSTIALPPIISKVLPPLATSTMVPRPSATTALPHSIGLTVAPPISTISIGSLISPSLAPGAPPTSVVLPGAPPTSVVLPGAPPTSTFRAVVSSLVASRVPSSSVSRNTITSPNKPLPSIIGTALSSGLPTPRPPIVSPTIPPTSTPAPSVRATVTATVATPVRIQKVIDPLQIPSKLTSLSPDKAPRKPVQGAGPAAESVGVNAKPNGTRGIKTLLTLGPRQPVRVEVTKKSVDKESTSSPRKREVLESPRKQEVPESSRKQEVPEPPRKGVETPKKVETTRVKVEPEKKQEAEVAMDTVSTPTSSPQSTTRSATPQPSVAMETPDGETEDDTPTKIKKGRSILQRTLLTRSRKRKAEDDGLSVESTDTEEDGLSSQATSAVPSPAPSQCSEMDADALRAHKQWKKGIMIVWRHAAQHKYANFFLHPVREEDAPGYKDIILCPTDLSTIKRKVESGVIKTDIEFQREMLLMFQNAFMYNSSDHEVYEIAQAMKVDVMENLQTYLATQAQLQLVEDPVPTKTLRGRRGDRDQSHDDSLFSPAVKKRRIRNDD